MQPPTPLVLAVDAMPRPRHWSSVPTEWFQRIGRERADGRVKCDHLACFILDDLLQFYRSVDIQQNGRIVRCRRFTADRFVQSYGYWEQKFGASRHEVRDSVELLVRLGLIRCERGTVVDQHGRRYPNRLVFEPVVDAIERITLGEDSRRFRTATLPPEFVIEIVEELPPVEVGEKGGRKRGADRQGQPSEEAAAPTLFVEPDMGGVPQGAEGCAPQGIPQDVHGAVVVPSESHDSDSDSPKRARPHARGRRAEPESLTEMIDAFAKTLSIGKQRSRASPRRATEPAAEKKAVTDYRFREAGKLVARWEELQHQRASTDGKDGYERLPRRATTWRWLFYRLLEEGHSAERILWTIERAARLGYPIDWPGRVEEGWHYLSDPASQLLPWRGAAQYSAGVRALEESNREARYKPEDTANWKRPDGYVSADDLFADFEGDAEESSAS